MKSLFSTIAMAAMVSGSLARAAQQDHSDRSGRTRTGAASYYSGRLAGKSTASGAPLRLGAMTAASPTLPLGTEAKVTNRATGRSVRVTVTDRGPFAKGRTLDVTPAAANRLGMKKDGVAPVEVKPIKLPTRSARRS